MHKSKLLVLIILLLASGCTQQKQDTVIYAEPVALGPVIIFAALDENYFNKEGLNVAVKQFSAGRLALDAVLTNNAQFGSTSETPIMHSILQGNDIIIVATVSEHHETKAIGRKDAGILKPQDLKGKKIATLPGTNSDYFMNLFLKSNGLSKKDVQIVSMKPPEMVIALVKGDIDAFFAWEPHIFFAKKELGNNFVIFEAGNLYSGTHTVFMQRSFAEKNPAVVKKLVSSLLKAEKFVKQNRKKAIEISAKHTGISKEALNEIFDDYYFEVKLDQSLLELLDKEADWAISTGVSNAIQKPNFREHIYTKALSEISPERVQVG